MHMYAALVSLIFSLHWTLLFFSKWACFPMSISTFWHSGTHLFFTVSPSDTHTRTDSILASSLATYPSPGHPHKHLQSNWELQQLINYASRITQHLDSQRTHGFIHFLQHPTHGFTKNTASYTTCTTQHQIHTLHAASRNTIWLQMNFIMQVSAGWSQKHFCCD